MKYLVGGAAEDPLEAAEINELNDEVAPADLIVGKKYFVKQLISEDRYYGNEFAVEHNTTYIATVKYVSEVTPSSMTIRYDWPWIIELTDLKPFSPASNVTRRFYTTEGKLHNRIFKPPVFYKYDVRRISEAAQKALGSSTATTLASKVDGYLNGQSIATLRATSKGGGTRKRKTGKKSKTGKKGKKSKTGKKGKKSKSIIICQ